MQRSCPANEFSYAIIELKAFRALAKSLFFQKNRRWEFFENSKRIF
jgi:hypothetical protein